MFWRFIDAIIGHKVEYVPDTEPEHENAHYVCSRCKKYLGSAYF